MSYKCMLSTAKPIFVYQAFKKLSVHRLTGLLLTRDQSSEAGMNRQLFKLVKTFSLRALQPKLIVTDIMSFLCTLKYYAVV